MLSRLIDQVRPRDAANRQTAFVIACCRLAMLAFSATGLLSGEGRPFKQVAQSQPDANALWRIAQTATQDDVAKSTYFGIRVVDQETGRGIPLVRLRTTSNIELWSDSAGWVAFHEPGLMQREIHFAIESPGYEMTADGFGFRGVRLTTTPGETAEVKLTRTQLAERCYRLTGQGIYADSERLGRHAPSQVPQLNSGVMGQDSVQMVRYQDQLFWLWGDTALPHYPLGVFHVTAATSPIPTSGQIDREHPIRLTYFEDPKTGFARAMMPTRDPGAVWLWGLINILDANGAETLVAHYSRHLSLGNMVEHGIAVWNPQAERFEKRATFDLENTWRVPRGQAFRHTDGDGDWVYFAEPFAVTRVPATLMSLLDPAAYQAFAWDSDSQQWSWQSDRPPCSQEQETQLIAAGSMPMSEARFQIVDRQSGDAVSMHRGSVNWNPFRQRWILIACEANRSGTPSHLGEIWYAESESISGPWREAIKVASHPKYSFYNPRHHAIFDEDDGRVIYFEGTYTQMFSGNPLATPRYDYNQILYRLDLSRIGDRETPDSQ